MIGRVDAAATRTHNDVRASEPGRALRLTPAAAAWLEKNEEGLMLRFYRYVVTHGPS